MSPVGNVKSGNKVFDPRLCRLKRIAFEYLIWWKHFGEIEFRKQTIRNGEKYFSPSLSRRRRIPLHKQLQKPPRQVSCDWFWGFQIMRRKITNFADYHYAVTKSHLTFQRIFVEAYFTPLQHHRKSNIVSLFSNKHRKNCECCPVSQLIVR